MAILGKAPSLTCKYQVRVKGTLTLTTTGKQVKAPLCKCNKTSFSWLEPWIFLFYFHLFSLTLPLC